MQISFWYEIFFIWKGSNKLVCIKHPRWENNTCSWPKKMWCTKVMTHVKLPTIKLYAQDISSCILQHDGQFARAMMIKSFSWRKGCYCVYLTRLTIVRIIVHHQNIGLRFRESFDQYSFSCALLSFSLVFTIYNSIGSNNRCHSSKQYHMSVSLRT